jgi:serine/threonine protein kinase
MLRERAPAVGYAHEYISPIWSASVATAGHAVPAIATPYYRNGNIFDYVCLHPSADRSDLVHQTASALAHIHSKDVVHGNICPVSFCLGHSFRLLISIGLAGKYMHR